MANTTAQDPFESTTLTNLRKEIDRLFDQRFFDWPLWGRGGAGSSALTSLAVDVLERDGKLFVRASLPGFAKDEIDVRLDDGVLSIQAEHREEEEEEKDQHYYRRERRYGTVTRRLSLPGVAADAPIDAELKDGVLTLVVPLSERAKPKQIEIKAG